MISRLYLTLHYAVFYCKLSEGAMVVILDRDNNNKFVGYATTRDPETRPSVLLSKAVVNMTERHLWRLGRDAGLHTQT